jgi:Mg-chelatase subunit ChlD
MKINIIAYSNGLRPYHPRMVKLDDITRRGIIAWVKTLRAHGKTNIYDAVEMVLLEARGRRGRPSKAMIVDTVMLLTDGQPTAGKVQASDLICSEVARLNEQTRIVIHTVGIGPDHDARLLKRLSAESQGVYVRAR